MVNSLAEIGIKNRPGHEDKRPLNVLVRAGGKRYSTDLRRVECSDQSILPITRPSAFWRNTKGRRQMTSLLNKTKARDPVRVARRLATLFIIPVILATGCGERVADSALRVAITSPTQPSYVETIYGPVHYGAEFGLNITADDFRIFDSHATATQTVLAGQADIVGGSFVSHLIIRERGLDFKMFCPFVNMDDFVMAGRNGVTEVEQLFDPDTRVAIDSPGGASGVILNAMLQAAGTGKTIADLPNVRILESSALRSSVFVADGVDATVIHLTQFKQAAEQVSDAVIITTLYKDVPVFIKEAFAAPASWLEENLELAASFCASVLKAARELPRDFDLFVSAVNEFVGVPPSEAMLRETFDLISTYEFWPKNGDLEPEAIIQMAKMAVLSGVLEEVPDPNEVVDRRPMNRALELLGGRVE